jgi:hypothetical protein
MCVRGIQLGKIDWYTPLVLFSYGGGYGSSHVVKRSLPWILHGRIRRIRSIAEFYRVGSSSVSWVSDISCPRRIRWI